MARRTKKKPRTKKRKHISKAKRSAAAKKGWRRKKKKQAAQRAAAKRTWRWKKIRRSSPVRSSGGVETRHDSCLLCGRTIVNRFRRIRVGDHVMISPPISFVCKSCRYRARNRAHYQRLFDAI